MLKYKTVKLVWESDLQDLILDTYGRRTEWAAEQEMSQNETRNFTVPSNRYVDEDSLTVAQWLAGETTELYGYTLVEPEMQLILNDLHARGLVEAGEYVVEVWW